MDQRMTGNGSVSVLVVDDDPQVRELFTDVLSGSFSVRTASDASTALEQLEDTVDVVLIDRRMPGLSGDDLLATIRAEGFNCRVAMVTAVQPSDEDLELRFDEYLRKPVSSDELRSTVDRLVSRANYQQHLQEWLALLSKKSAFERERSQDELEDSDEYQTLLADIEDRRTEAEAHLEDLTSDQFEALFREIGSDRLTQP